MQFAVLPLDDALIPALQHKIDNKTKPLGSLGLLETVALQVGRIQKTLSPTFSNPHMLIFAGDHGAATAGISAYPQDVSWQMVENYLQGGAGANVFSSQHGMTMVVVDAGIAHEFGEREGLINAKISPSGTRNYLVEPAMTREQAIRYMIDNSPMPESDATAEVERYIAIPGQALAYKIGQLTMLRLKADAKQKLGAKFDPRGFHATLLDTGALPMPVLERKVADWIAGQR